MLHLPSHFKLTETSSRYARKISGTTALQEALKEKQQHIEQLLAERDLERAEVAKANSRICEVEKELSVLKAQHVQVQKQPISEEKGGVTVPCNVLTSSVFNTLNQNQLSSLCPQYVTENESALQQVQTMLASTQKDKLELANQLEEEKRLRRNWNMLTFVSLSRVCCSKNREQRRSGKN
ncbi:hypothetical protein GOODEAATRI_018455 [Goodea atripinnis]|uniref:Uncharacterized protein n=1 Tax=Goodea atripinnis TaxID=208336 RepID=A0ABV0MIW2_9TELE